MAKSKIRTAIRYFVGPNPARDGMVRVSIFPKRADAITKVVRLMKQAGYVQADEQAYKRLQARTADEMCQGQGFF